MTKNKISWLICKLHCSVSWNKQTVILLSIWTCLVERYYMIWYSFVTDWRGCTAAFGHNLQSRPIKNIILQKYFRHSKDEDAKALMIFFLCMTQQWRRRVHKNLFRFTSLRLPKVNVTSHKCIRPSQTDTHGH